MIIIEDNDFPVEVAVKIIKGTKPAELNELQRRMRGYLLPESLTDDQTMDMFTLEELREIAEHLIVYYNSHCMDGD